ncbi:hypothetical protein [Qipengyuania sp. ASV99]|uniref:hypothetical protein n=1 Tax=Qipengyuania sp. ASV99 TaxID=3399681 RepID=UPI003A4C663A
MLSLAAAALYCLVVLSCLGAGYFARLHRQQGWHARSWSIIAVLFAVLVILRLFNIEEGLRADLRGWLRSADMIDNRRIVQGWIIAACIAAFAGLGLLATYWINRRISGRRNIAVAIAAGASGIMIVTIALRSISLHAMDRLLYGPLKLNWVGDIGSSAAILCAAAYYIWLIRQMATARRR